MAANSAAQSVADFDNGMILASVEIGAAPERVFEALTRSEDVMRWWGDAESYRTTHWEADVRPGGKWKAGGKMPDGRTYAVEGEFTEVEKPHRLTFTWRPDWDAPHQTQVTYRLEPIEGGTLLTLRHEGFGDRMPALKNHRNGWKRVLGWLETDQKAQEAPRQYFLFKLLPPRVGFMGHMTPEEMSLMMQHVGYWTGKMREGKVIAFGPVADPAGSFGMGVMRVEDAAEVSTLTAGDPVMLAQQGFQYEVFPMPRIVHI